MPHHSQKGWNGASVAHGGLAGVGVGAALGRRHNVQHGLRGALGYHFVAGLQQAHQVGHRSQRGYGLHGALDWTSRNLHIQGAFCYTCVLRKVSRRCHLACKHLGRCVSAGLISMLSTCCSSELSPQSAPVSYDLSAYVLFLQVQHHSLHIV